MRHVVFLALLLAQVLSAEILNPAPIPPVVEEPKLELELGASLGIPALGNIQFGIWKRDGFPFVARISGMFWGIVGGGDAEVGWLFDSGGDFLQYAGFGFEAGVFGPVALLLSDASWVGGSIRYGLRYKGFVAMVGMTLGHGDGNWLFVFPDNYTGPMPLFKVGYSWFF